MTRVAIYARYSSDNQREASIEDQVRLCKERAVKEGWSVVNIYPDHAISGASLMRPGIQMLLQDARNKKFDIVLSEALDRISRDQADIASVKKQLAFIEVGMVTLAEGEINEMHIGLKGTMNALFLKDLADKTRRGLRGRVENGKSGGGITYGYDVVKKLDGNGEPIKGEREVNKEQAKIVNRIFEEYSAGKSPRSIAKQLNEEKIPGPSGKAWGASTIYGNRQRGTGILNNELYIGRMVWNRLRYIKDPETGKRVSRLNPEKDWIIKKIPELRVIEQDLWDTVKSKQGKINKHSKTLWKTNRPKNLFSYLLKCGCCGGGYSVVSKDHVGCSTARNKGTCSNRLTMHKDKLEQSVLSALKNNLMDEKLCAEFCNEYVSHVNKLRMEHNASLNGYQAEYDKVKRQLDKMVDAIADGAALGPIKDKLHALDNRRIELLDIIENTEEAPVLFHPNMSKKYHREIQNLIASLNSDKHRAEAAELIRSLVDKIVLTPTTTGDRLVVDLHGDLAGILSVATQSDKFLVEKNLSWFNPEKRETDFLGESGAENLKFQAVVAGGRNKRQSRKDSDRIQALVAGVGFEPTTFRL